MEALPEVLTIIEAAQFLRLDPRTVQRLTKARKIPFKKIGGSIRFSRTALERFIGVPDGAITTANTPSSSDSPLRIRTRRAFQTGRRSAAGESGNP